ncbi:hypothetical protein V8F06_006067 [Rhypophila decipiens]
MSAPRGVGSSVGLDGGEFGGPWRSSKLFVFCCFFFLSLACSFSLLAFFVLLNFPWSLEHTVIRISMIPVYNFVSSFTAMGIGGLSNPVFVTIGVFWRRFL